MKIRISTFLFLLVVSLFSNAQSIESRIASIQQVLQNQQQAWNEGDIEGFMMGYWQSDSLTFIGKKGITRGWQASLDNYKKSYPDKVSMGELQFNIVAIKLLSKTNAFVVGKWHLKRQENKGDLQGHFTLLFKKINNVWLIISDHSS